MRSLAVLFCLGFFSACSTLQPYETPDITPPQLLLQHPVPALPKSVLKQDLMLDMYIYVAEDGSVKSVRFNTGSGNAEWDALAISVIRLWRYSPARINNRPVRLWLHQVANIQVADPKYISLGAILCSTPEEADSIYAALERGTDFSALAEEHSAHSRMFGHGILGEVDIHSYPRDIQQVLLQLDADIFSKPVKYGEHYAIFKRLKE